jgi:hypothetical protein
LISFLKSETKKFNFSIETEKFYLNQPQVSEADKLLLRNVNIFCSNGFVGMDGWMDGWMDG